VSVVFVFLQARRVLIFGRFPLVVDVIESWFCVGCQLDSIQVEHLSGKVVAALDLEVLAEKLPLLPNFELEWVQQDLVFVLNAD